MDGADAKWKAFHILKALPPKEFQGPLQHLLWRAPSLVPAPSIAAAARDPVTGSVVISRIEPIDENALPPADSIGAEVASGG